MNDMYVQNLYTFDLSVLTSKISVVGMFVIDGLQKYVFHNT
jgi:hypothetical protein